MIVNVEVVKASAENNSSLLRRFTKRVQGSGVLPRVRSIRYKERNQSYYKRKKQTLKSIRNRAEREELIKLGKIAEKTPGRSR